MDSEPGKMFGEALRAKTHGQDAPAANHGQEAHATTLKTPWVRVLLTCCGVLLVLAVCIEIYLRAQRHGEKVIEAHPVEVGRIEITNPPAWLDRAIVQNHLLAEAVQFLQRDEQTMNRARNVLDRDLLHEIADLYTGVETVDGRESSRQRLGYNAWISRIVEVRRDVAADRSVQTIRIVAEWRKPAAWVRVGDKMYLLDAEATRLPGEYPATGKPPAELLAISGVELPVVDGHAVVPQPGLAWTAGSSGAVGADLLAGMKLAALLAKQKYARQIESIDMSNYQGRRNTLEQWIVLLTDGRKADGTPRQVRWGRGIGEGWYHEVSTEQKLKHLDGLFTQHKRIDAGRDYVEVWKDDVMGPKLASEAEAPVRLVRG